MSEPAAGDDTALERSQEAVDEARAAVAEAPVMPFDDAEGVPDDGEDDG